MRREAATVHRRLGQGQVALQVLQVGGDDALLYDTGLDGHEGQGGCATGFLRPYPIAYPDDRDVRESPCVTAITEIQSCLLLAQSGHPNTLTNVRFRGQSGHWPDFLRCLVLTQSGH